MFCVHYVLFVAMAGIGTLKRDDSSDYTKLPLDLAEISFDDGDDSALPASSTAPKHVSDPTRTYD